ncbi:Plant protein of unknown function (DUF828) with plant pleckstrin homology-like region [Striga hermonthica]|uniref:PH domain-containing protein n=1 Tax=Striga hermonthica TaxID=68872 RepID=A0A9N7RCJ7_STRHE|nr:Plant protein of unknown function (DUF828) with plant pleckstrin homology-like region [Striga hermonthica]
MDSCQFSSYFGLVQGGDDDNQRVELPALPHIPQPKTPKEPMEFLSRSWTLNADQISEALATKNTRPAACQQTKNPENFPLPQNISGTITKTSSSGATAMGRFFNHKEGNTMRKKDKARLESAHTHALVSVAGLAAALASLFASADKSKSSSPEMRTALASATKLLASYCIELAESGGAHREHVTSVVRSAVQVHTESHLLTLTAAAATALRGEAALKARLPKEAKRSGAAVSPYDKVLANSPSQATFQSEIEKEDLPCVGDLLQLTQKGVLQWRNVSVYINKACEVTIKLKSRHIGVAFYRKNKCIVYEVIDESDEWPFKKGREYVEVNFGVKTSQGLLEFKCRNKVHKQKWVCAIRKLLERSTKFEEAKDALRKLNINKSI